MLYDTFQLLLCPFPVDHLDPILDIVLAEVVVLEVIGVFPNVNYQNGLQSLFDGAVLVWGSDDF